MATGDTGGREMVTKDSGEENILTKVARTVSSALGNAASKAADAAETMQGATPG
jgi:hypothetical protein